METNGPKKQPAYNKEILIGVYVNAITYKTVMDLEGAIIGIELWQGDQHIGLTLETHVSSRGGRHWLGVKETVDHIVAGAHQFSLAGARDNSYMQYINEHIKRKAQKSD